MNFKDQWNLDMALEVLSSESVNSQTWAEAVKWMLLFGPSEIRQMLLQASTSATSNFFPQLKPAGFNENGDPYFDVSSLAEVLGMDPETLQRSLGELEDESGFRLAADEEDLFKIQ